MLQAERLEKIRDYLVANKYASIAELAEAFETSPATIRRGLKELEQKKVVESIRVRGKVIAPADVKAHYGLK